MKIKLEQAVFGEKNRGHSLLDHTFDTSKIPNEIALHTDLPSGHTDFPSYAIYYSATSTLDYYVLIKSFPDSSAERSGFVYSYCLFIKKCDLIHTNSLLHLFELLPNKIDKESTLYTIEYGTTETSSIKVVSLEKIKKIAYGLLNDKLPIVWLRNEGFLEAISVIWNNLIPELKSKFQFRVSFGPKDIEHTKEQIVYSPIGLKDKWESHFTINETADFEYEYTDAIKFLVDNETNDNQIKNLIASLSYNVSSFSDLKSIALLSRFLSKDDFHNLLNALALLAKLLPDAKSGAELKQQLVEKVCIELKKGNIDNILSFRNVELSHIKETSCIKKEINSLFQKWNFKDGAEQLFSSIKNKDVQRWWKDTLDKSILSSLSNWNEKYSKLFWSLVTKDTSNIEFIENYIPNQTKVELDMVKYIPAKLTDDLYKELIEFSTKRKWYVMHAWLVSKKLTPVEALEKQLQIDTEETYLNGLVVLSNNISAKEFLKYTTSNPENRLIVLSVSLVSENISLIDNLDVNNHTWLEIWLKRSSIEGIEVFKGIKSPKKKIHQLLDVLISGNQIPNDLLLLCSQSDFSNISDYKKRSSIWDFLSDEIKSNFLKNTALACLNLKLLDYDSFDIENEIVQEIETHNLLGNITKNDAENILQLFIDYPILSETNLMSFLERVKYSLNKKECLKLGQLLSLRRWNNVYKKVKSDYSKSNSNFKETIDVCKDDFPKEKSLIEGLFGNKSKNRNMKKIFISYSRKDVDFKDGLLTHLKPLEKYSLIKAWDCSKIRAGEWDEQIQQELESSDIMIFMVSANFMASDYIIDNEVQKGIELAKEDSSKKILCVLVKECIWSHWPILDENFRGDGSSDLSRFQFLPYYKSNGEEAILALEDWGKERNKSVNHAYKQVVEKLINELD